MRHLQSTIRVGFTRKHYYRALFLVSAAVNLVAGVSCVFASEQVSISLGVESVPETPLLAMYADLFGLAVVLFGVAYFIAAVQPEANHSYWLILLGAVGKISVFGIMSYYVVFEDVPWKHAGITFVLDALFACLFVEYLVWHRRALANRQF